MSEWLMGLAVQRSDVVLGVMVVAAALNVYAFIRQQKMLGELRRLLLRAQRAPGAGAWERRRPLMLNGVGHRYSVTPRIIGSELDDD